MKSLKDLRYGEVDVVQFCQLKNPNAGPKPPGPVGPHPFTGRPQGPYRPGKPGGRRHIPIRPVPGGHHRTTHQVPEPHPGE